MRDFEFPGRSVVHSGEAMAATSHPLATSTAVDMLRRGGSAMDAAIAAAAVLAVVEPTETGIGGDCFALYAPNGKLPPAAFNGSGRTPRAAELPWYLEQGFTEISADSPHAVTVPGAVDAWCQLHDAFGRLDFADLLAPAIGYARDGHVVHERGGRKWRDNVSTLMNDEETARVFLPNGRAPEVGDVFRNPLLARTLETIAAHGRSGFYEGEIAEAIVGHLRQRGGLHTPDDFAETRGDFVDPISAEYRGRQVFQLPPNTQGVIALLMLKLLAGHNPGEHAFMSPERVHLGVEAGRIAMALRQELLGDFDASGDLLRILKDDARIDALSKSIVPGRARPGLSANEISGSNTVYLTVVDRDRNAASFINSLYKAFGSGLCAPGTGVLLQNRGRDFRLDPQHPNAIGPRKRPLHTIIPGMTGSDGRVDLSFGVMGGDYQPTGHVHLLSAIYDHGLDLQAACDAPRYLAFNGRVQLERGVPHEVRESLSRWGHRLEMAPEPLGGAQVIRIDWERGTLSAGSEPRKDGCALGY